jgi:choline dehydrogenase-like flavoprotein
MKNERYPDVLVVGAGPGGSAAAKYCAEAGLKTILIEKKKIPRDKVCTGMIMGRCGRTDSANHLRRHWQCNKKRYRCCTINCRTHNPQRRCRADLSVRHQRDNQPHPASLQAPISIKGEADALIREVSF